MNVVGLGGVSPREERWQKVYTFLHFTNALKRLRGETPFDGKLLAGSNPSELGDSIPSFVTPQCNSSPKQIQAMALAAATASVPAAAPLAMAATPEPPQASESEMPHSDETAEIAECSFSNVENWINREFDELDALDSHEDPWCCQFPELVEQSSFSWPMSEDFDDAAVCSMMHHDMQLWSFP